jgi:hypothetical protein
MGLSQPPPFSLYFIPWPFLISFLPDRWPTTLSVQRGVEHRRAENRRRFDVLAGGGGFVNNLEEDRSGLSWGESWAWIQSHWLASDCFPRGRFLSCARDLWGVDFTRQAVAQFRGGDLARALSRAGEDVISGRAAASFRGEEVEEEEVMQGRAEALFSWAAAEKKA